MRFSPGRNARLVIKRNVNNVATTIYPTTGTVEVYVGPPVSTGRNIQNYPPEVFGKDGSMEATDVIIIRLPASTANKLLLEDNDQFIITGASAQKNGSYSLLGRPSPVDALVPGADSSIRCYVRERRQG